MSAIISVESEHLPAGEALCANCGAPLAGKFCGACGEKRLDHHDLTMAHVLGHAVHEVTHFDSKLFNTLRFLIVRPGFLTREYFDGRRTRYVSPLRIYLTIFAASLFLYSFTRELNIWDVGKLVAADKTGNWKTLLASVAARKATTIDVLVEAINHGWQHWISMLQFVTVGLLAAGLAIIYIRSQRHFVEHFVFALHVVSFALLAAIVSWPLWRITGFDPRKMNVPLVAVTMAIDGIYFILAVKTFYSQRPVKTVIKGLLTFGIYYASTVVVTALALVVAAVSVLRK